jgi:hypothetical protein
MSRMTPGYLDLAGDQQQKRTAQTAMHYNAL